MKAIYKGLLIQFENLIKLIVTNELEKQTLLEIIEEMKQQK